jgi:hypothetical protein
MKPRVEVAMSGIHIQHFLRNSLNLKQKAAHSQLHLACAAHGSVIQNLFEF